MKVMRIAQSFETFDQDSGTVEDKFKRQASLKEGISGRKRIDTTFENYETTEVEAPRSDYNSLPDDDYKPGDDISQSWRNW